MRDPIAAYLEKRADLKSRPLIFWERQSPDWHINKAEQIVVIPALAEYDHIFETLDCLRQNDPMELQRTLVICVINNRKPPLVTPEQFDNNQRTLERLRSDDFTPLRLAYVDASSPGCELPDKGGVGAARKIGLDWGLAVLYGLDGLDGRRFAYTTNSLRSFVQNSEFRVPSSAFLLSLDADTHIEPNYLSAVRAHFEQTPRPWAAVIAYAHRLDDPGIEPAAIVCYELFLRYLALGLRYARSPYAFHTIGSAMACTAQAYAAISGMNQRQAGEDFYFLQQLAKTGPVDDITTTTVHPSGRASWRVPFGTGQRVNRYLNGEHDEYAVYNPEIYRVLHDWLVAVAGNLDASPDQLLAKARAIAPELESFLVANDFANAWASLQKNAPNPAQLHAQFHRWFDGFKTLKLIHRLRDNGYPQTDLFEAIATLLTWTVNNGGPAPSPVIHKEDLASQITLLEFLRQLP